MLQRPSFGLRDHFSLHGLAGTVNGVRISRNQIVPVWQRLMASTQFIGTTVRQPVKALQIAAGKSYAIGNMKFAATIVTAPGLFNIQQLAGDIGHVYLAVILILGLEQTAFATPVAQSLPLGPVQGFQWLFPKRWLIVQPTHLAISFATS